MTGIEWCYFPKHTRIPDSLEQIVKIFEENHKNIDSDLYKLNSNKVLAKIREDLKQLGFKVESSKKKSGKIYVPVLFGLNGKIKKSFEADAYNEETATVVEVEAGRGVTNYQFLKDLFQACMMQDVKYLTIAVRKVYLNSNDFKRVVTFFDTLYSSTRLELPLNGVLVIGY